MSVPTLRDVAALAGVHPAIASRARNPSTKDMTSADTAQRVIRAAEQLGYRPDAVARSLRTARSSSIGVVVPDLTNPFSRPSSGIEAALAPHGYVLLIVNTDNNLVQEAQLIASLRARSIDGLLLATARLSHPLIETLAARDLPVVLVNRRREGLPLPCVVPDDAAGIQLAVAHPGRPRPPPHRAHRRAAGHLHRGSPAAGVPGRSGRARAGGRRCAGHVVRFVVGGRGRAPALTTVHVPQHDLGGEAARLPLDQMTNFRREEPSVLMPVTLSVRESTGPPAQAADRYVDLSLASGMIEQS